MFVITFLTKRLVPAKIINYRDIQGPAFITNVLRYSLKLVNNVINRLWSTVRIYSKTAVFLLYLNDLEVICNTEAIQLIPQFL